MKDPASHHVGVQFPPVDVARGLSMLLVVSMYTILGIEAEAGQRSGAHWFVDFANAFRVPAFFLISGLLLRRAMSLGWADLFKKRIFGLLVLFTLWSAIHIGIRMSGTILADPVAGIFGGSGLFMTLVAGFAHPFGLLLFLYLMIAFLLAARALFQLPPLLVLGVAILLETARISTGMPLVDAFSSRFFYFYLGIMLAPKLFPFFRGEISDPGRLSDKVPASDGMLTLFLGLWFLCQILIVQGGYDHWRGVSILTGLAGIAALFAVGLLLARHWPEGWLTRLLRMIGNRAIVIFLVFTIPMTALRRLFLTLWPEIYLSLLAALVIIAALAISILVERLVRRTALARLFDRPVLGASRPEFR